MTDSRSQTAANSNTVETSFSCPTSAYTHPHPAVPAQTVRRRRRVRWSAIIDMIPVCFWAGEMVIQRSAFVLFQFRPSPIALEPCADQKAAVLSLLIRLPSGTLPYTPPGQSGKISHRLPSYKHITFIWITLKQKGKIIFFFVLFFTICVQNWWQNVKFSRVFCEMKVDTIEKELFYRSSYCFNAGFTGFVHQS